MIYFISNPEISRSDTKSDRGYISLSDNNFLWEFKAHAENPYNIDISFEIGDDNKNYKIVLSAKDLDPYIIKNNKVYLKNSEKFYYAIDEDKIINYFNENFKIKFIGKKKILIREISKEEIKNKDFDEVYNEDGRIFINDNNYTLRKIPKEADQYIIIKNNLEKTPIFTETTYINDNISSRKILFENENFYYVPELKTFRIIVSKGGKYITLWRSTKNIEKFEKIKTFLFPGGLRKAFIKIGIDESMNLSDMSFSFFKTNVE